MHKLFLYYVNFLALNHFYVEQNQVKKHLRNFGGNYRSLFPQNYRYLTTGAVIKQPLGLDELMYLIQGHNLSSVGSNPIPLGPGQDALPLGNKAPFTYY